MNGVSFASLDGELLRLMKKAGFDTVNLSLVQHRTDHKGADGRPKTAVEFDTVLGEVETAGLRNRCLWNFGMAGQTLGEMVDTLIYISWEKGSHRGPASITQPGTPLFEQCKAEGSLPLHRPSGAPAPFRLRQGISTGPILSPCCASHEAIQFNQRRMDKRELDEGVTWEGLLKGLRDRSNAGAGGQEGTLMTEHSAAWRQILWRLYEERTFFRLKKKERKGSGPFRGEDVDKGPGLFFEEDGPFRLGDVLIL